MSDRVKKFRDLARTLPEGDPRRAEALRAILDDEAGVQAADTVGELPGFAGVRGAVLGTAIDGAHVVRLVEYRFPDGSVVPYVEVIENHEEARPLRLVAISSLVHLIQNVTDDELWSIGARQTPGGGA